LININVSMPIPARKPNWKYFRGKFYQKFYLLF
jgi:hypothetical protein